MSSGASGFDHLPLECFNTEKVKYILDVKNSIFLEVDDCLYEILAALREKEYDLGQLIEALKDQFDLVAIEDSWISVKEMQKHGVLVKDSFCRELMPWEDVKRYITEEMKSITLFMTTECNLSCSYCVYGGGYEKHRKLSREKMGIETAKDAIEFLFKNSTKSEEINIIFFGGEPLLSLHEIRECVKYIKGIQLGKPVNFSLITNGTLMNDETWEYLIENAFNVQVSIDVDQKCHDMNRKFKGNGDGSYYAIIKNLEKLCEKNLNYFSSKVRLKSVITKDTMGYSDGKSDHPIVEIAKSHGRLALTFEEPHYNMNFDANYLKSVKCLGEEILEMRGITRLACIQERLNIKQWCLFEQTFKNFFKFQTEFREVKEGGLCFRGCITGAEASVDVNGDISICLKAKKFKIGNVNQGGWDLAALERYHLAKGLFKERCSGCFMQKMCTLCYEKLDADAIEKSFECYCEFWRKINHYTFEIMLKVCENNPELWSEVQRNLENTEPVLNRLEHISR